MNSIVQAHCLIIFVIFIVSPKRMCFASKAYFEHTKTTKMINATLGNIYTGSVSRGEEHMYHVNSSEAVSTEEKVTDYDIVIEVCG